MHFDLVPPKHGGDLAYWQRKVGSQALAWLDLSSACNREPWPIPDIDPKLWNELPDQAALLAQATRYYGLRPSAIGAGSQHIIESLPALLSERLKQKVVMVPRIGYQEHAFAWQKWGYDIAYYNELDELLTQTWQVAVVIQPNNPTGRLYDFESLQAVLDKAESMDAYLVVDEAFMDPQPEHSFLSACEASDWPKALFVLRSVGKFFGLAGARVGFAFCSTRWEVALNNLLGPWPVATPSLFLIGAAFDDLAWQAQAKQSLAERQALFVSRVMPKLNTIFDSQQHTVCPLFVTWHLESSEYAERVFEMLHTVGVHTRLGEGWIRVALPARDEIDRLDKALIGLLKTAGGRELA
ncbi:aminotransferase class I/II-fold pyridoxal phosphate-dependent enzyme [Marinomonas pollencensis]|uniref:Aminotransferase n=1 Tax=Marinomonas pollencensis TaxID=491954 RepID=A0A3E0DA18_9GAMM|nr:aminotransferase class I/II-fold pyridoxal phosphate-dependent enzyme [Marinomonas pollencensis]REG79519.1 L-threonine O-3-phosphate decarboxylase [Marinomonas pollencensis]